MDTDEDEPTNAKPQPQSSTIATDADASKAADEVNPIKQPMPSVQAANSSMQDIANAPAIPANPGAGRSSSVSNTQTVNVGKIEVTTQATDAQGIASSMTDGLKNAYGDMANQYDDGRSH